MMKKIAIILLMTFAVVRLVGEELKLYSEWEPEYSAQMLKAHDLGQVYDIVLEDRKRINSKFEGESAEGMTKLLLGVHGYLNRRFLDVDNGAQEMMNRLNRMQYKSKYEVALKKASELQSAYGSRAADRALSRELIGEYTVGLGKFYALILDFVDVVYPGLEVPSLDELDAKMKGEDMENSMSDKKAETPMMMRGLKY